MAPRTPSSDSSAQIVEQSRRATLASLLEIDDDSIRQLTRLTLPEIQSVKHEVSQVLPAGNLPAFVLSGLLKLKGREISADQVTQDLAALMRGVSLIPQGLYGAFVAGPAAVLYAYQKLLQLAGKEPSDAFPDGTWQFYLQFGLREDAARHTNETTGFHRSLPSRPDPVAMAAAWVCAVLEFLYSYDDLLAAIWTEGVVLRLLTEELSGMTDGSRASFVQVVREWREQCPYHRPSDGSAYLAYRQAVFARFLQEHLRDLPPGARDRFHRGHAARLVGELPAYQEQMSLLAALQPELYQEHKEPIPFWEASVAFIWQGYTYLLPVCRQGRREAPVYYATHSAEASPRALTPLPGGRLQETSTGQPVLVDRGGRVWYQESGRLIGLLRPPAPETVYGWLEAILSSPAEGTPPSLDLLLTGIPRPLHRQLRGKLPETSQAELKALRTAPIILNWDCRPHEIPLAYIRRGRRGVGDHALTVFRTEQSVVFDQSHIFFDGVWGLAVGEMLTDSAVHWYTRMAQLGQRQAVPKVRMPQPLKLKSTPQVEAIAQSHHTPGEVSAESDAVETHHLVRLRQWLQQRGVRLTLNDILLLYRFFHAAWYQPSRTLVQAQEAFHSRAHSPDAQAACQAVEATLARLRQTNPAMLIPMDAGNVSPRERVFPTTFRNPLTEVCERFAAAQDCCRGYFNHADVERWAAFDRERRELLTYLKAFGELMDALKAVTMRGESFNTATIRLLAHLPSSMQHLLDQIPQRIGILNEVIKGNEVFSNVGRVAPGTSLTRFSSAKDDGQTKELIWGILTDDQGRMHITLRDFRPFVAKLLALGEAELAGLLAQDYLDSYVQGLNRFVNDLSAIITLKEQADT
jgi:hypothetical protein